MKTYLLLICVCIAIGCTKNSTPVNDSNNNPGDTLANNPVPDETFDLDLSLAPKFVRFNYIDPDSIEQISLFRSGIGHDYSDDFESCRSMKHYFMPKVQTWANVKIFSPVDGTVVRVIDEWAGSQVHIQSDEYPAFSFRIFHVNLFSSVKVGTKLAAGQQIGNHISNETMSDIAVAVHTSLDGPNDNTNREKGLRLISFFQIMTDSLFNTYGAASRNVFTISSSERDGDPLDCNGESFGSNGTIENWKTLK
jgi:hypothetical protein